jgi:hypothetical protein
MLALFTFKQEYPSFTHHKIAFNVNIIIYISESFSEGITFKLRNYSLLI